jgi:hypothetical protein
VAAFFLEGIGDFGGVDPPVEVVVIFSEEEGEGKAPRAPAK